MPVAPDPYLPGHGDSRYSVEHYDLSLDYKMATNRLQGRATLRVRALTATAALRVDLSGLHVDKLRVDGEKPKRYTHKARAIEIKLATSLEEGDVVVVDVSYSGKPAPVPGPHGPAGWEELSDGILVASQPDGSPSWFPCNDRADDKASYRITVTADPEYLSLATGVLVAESTSGGRLTRVFEQAEPTSPYLVCLHLGRLRVTALAPRVYVAHPRALTPASGGTVGLLPDMVTAAEGWFGPYPFSAFTAVVVEDALEIPLESQGMASFGSNHLVEGWENERLVVHELAHQWFGNAVTAALMKDIWLHEGFACYAEWLWSEHRGLGKASDRARQHWELLKSEDQSAPLSDPGAAHMFDDWVYKRGALTVHALRVAVGDEAFFDILRAWVPMHGGTAVSTAHFVKLAEGQTGAHLSPLFKQWLDQLALPAFPR
ncbi:MAG: M1 family metallopeptidase [Actinomycetes bacterium]